MFHSPSEDESAVAISGSEKDIELKDFLSRCKEPPAARYRWRLKKRIDTHIVNAFRQGEGVDKPHRGKRGFLLTSCAFFAPKPCAQGEISRDAISVFVCPVGECLVLQYIILYYVLLIMALVLIVDAYL